MATGFYTWSKTPASNATADTTINMAEGMAPSGVNDGIRAAMARLAEFRDDISGGLTTGGTSTAYTVSTNQVFASLSVLNKQIITIIPHATSGASPTLAVDGLTAQAINYSTGSAVPTGALKSGTPYALIYLSATTEFIVLGALAALPPLAGPCPVGSLMDYAGTSAPTGWLLCYGQAISRTTYATLFAAISTTFGTGDGSTTFNLPDCRGRVAAGKDDMGGSSANRLTNQTGGLNGDNLGATGGAETHTLTTAQLAAHSHGVTDPGHGHTLNNATSVWNDNGTGNLNQTLAASAARATITVNNNTTGISINNAGSGEAHNNVQPTIIFNKIIFAGV